MRAWIGIEIVTHENEVEPAALGDARDLLHLIEILEARHRPGIAPAGDVAACAQDEQPEMHLPLHDAVTSNSCAIVMAWGRATPPARHGLPARS